MKRNRFLSMKLLLGVCFAIFFTVTLSIASAQSAPDIEWQKCLGGSNSERADCIQQTSDGGYIVAGSSLSNDGNVTGNHRDLDYWVVRLDRNGGIVWQKCLGGSNSDRAYSIQQTSDGGYIVAGNSDSNDIDVTGNHGCNDYWVVKLDTSGSIEWQKCLGGSYCEDACNIQQTSDGGYIIAGYTESNDGDVTGIHGYNDYWVVKLDTSGNIVWQKCLGGSNCEDAGSIQQTSDGGYIVAGNSDSNDGNVTGNHGLPDYWIVKLDTNGNIVWQKCLGGSGIDVAYSIQQTSDGGYIIAGYTDSNDGNVTGNHGYIDYWVVKLDTNGNIVWQKCLGGSSGEIPRSIQQTSDGGYIIAGDTWSNDEDVTGNHGENDYWVVRLDTSGIMVWQKCLGGSSAETPRSIQQTSDGGYIVAGHTGSNDGNVTGNHGYSDYWIVKLGEDSNTPVNVEAGPDQVMEEGASVNFEGRFTPSGSHAYSYHWDFGDGSEEDSSLVTSHTYADNRNYKVNLTVTDEEGNSGNDTLTVTVNNVAPEVGIINSPVDPIKIGAPVTVDSSFTDAGTLDTHTAVWDWDESPVSDGVVTENSGSGTVSGTHTYSSADVYKINLTVTDDDSGSNYSVSKYIVIYDPEGGFVTGGGWINSPEGAYLSDTTLTGTANFGFVSKYKKGATVPTGVTQFNFKVADLNFHSDTYDWLVIAGARAQYKGTGTINGEGEYGFMLTAIDGELNGGRGSDKFRIKIWNKASDEVIYDNMLGADDDADLTTEIQGGSITIHQEK